MFAPMCRISDQALTSGINDKIEVFERYLSDQNRDVIRNFENVKWTIATLDSKPDRAINTDLTTTGRACHPFGSLPG